MFDMVGAYLLELAIGVGEGGAAGNDEPWRDGGRWMVWRFQETDYSHHAVTKSLCPRAFQFCTAMPSTTL